MAERTEADLIQLSPRLLHDVQVFFRVGRGLARSGLGFGRQLTWEAETAMVESFAAHARGLSDFFYRFKKGQRETDAIAAHFFARGEWQTLAPPQGQWLQQISFRRTKGSMAANVDRFGQEIAHLNYIGRSPSDAARGWPIMQVMFEVGRALWAFATNVDRAKVCPGFVERAISEVPVSARVSPRFSVCVVWAEQVRIRSL